MNSNDTSRSATLDRNPNETIDQTTTVDQLNEFLRGEMSAVETYRQAAEKMQKDSAASNGLAVVQAGMKSHAARVQALRAEVERMGGKASDGSGLWGTFANLVQGAAELFGEKSAINALEEGEDHGLKEYKEGFEKLDTATRQWIENNIWPEQKKSHNAMRDLKHSLENKH